jgi:hypothetical protein
MREVLVRRFIPILVAVFGVLALTAAPAAAETSPATASAAVRSCPGATTELLSERQYNKLNVRTCVLVDGTKVRGSAMADCYFYKGLGWWNDQPCDLKVQFLIEYRRTDTTFQVDKSGVIKVHKATGEGLTATMGRDSACPKGTTAIRVTAGLVGQQYWTDNGAAERPFGLVSHTFQRGC